MQSKAENPWKAALPLSRVKTIMKQDPNVGNITLDGVYAVTVATQLFLELLTMEAHQFSMQEGRKGISYRDVSNAVNDIHEFEFLTQICPLKISYEEALQRKDAFDEMQEAQKELN